MGFYLGRALSCLDFRPLGGVQAVFGALSDIDFTPTTSNTKAAALWRALLAGAYSALAASLVVAATLRVFSMTRRASIEVPRPPTPMDRRRNRRITACTMLRIRVTPTSYPTMETALLDASTGGLALEWQGPTLPIDSRVKLNINGYSAVQAVIVIQDGNLLRLRFADAASRGEREWLRLACLSGSTLS